MRREFKYLQLSYTKRMASLAVLHVDSFAVAHVDIFTVVEISLSFICK